MVLLAEGMSPLSSSAWPFTALGYSSVDCKSREIKEMGSMALSDGIKVSIQLYIKLETAYSYTDNVSLNNECPTDSARMQSHPSLNSSSHVYTYIRICIHVVYTVCAWMSTYMHV